MIMRGGVFGVLRIARHLWRMSFGPFVASGSSFLGQQKAFPAFLRKPPVMLHSALLPLFLLIFWLLRVRFAKGYKQKLLSNRGNVQSPSIYNSEYSSQTCHREVSLPFCNLNPQWK
jgi:hypothetical protein